MKISNFKYRQALTKLRVSLHDLMIEKGRHSRVFLNVCDRLCPLCNVIENEIHFLVSCSLYSNERRSLFHEINIDTDVEPTVLFNQLMTLENRHHLEKLGEFIYHSFKKRKDYILGTQN